MEFDLTQSLTWPFAEPHGDVPKGLVADAHIVGADSCEMTSIMVSAGCVFASASVHIDGSTVEVSTGTVPLERNGKVQFYDDVGKSYGWILTGDILPETLVVSGVSYALAQDACLPFDGYEPLNQSGMTGDWMVVGTDGIVVTPQASGTLNLSFNTDEDGWYTVDDPNYTEKQSGRGIWTVNGLSGGITLTVPNAKITPSYDSEGIYDIEIIPQMVLYSDSPDGTYKSFTTFPNIVNDHSWSNGYGDTLAYNGNGTFTVNLGGVSRTVLVDETVVNYIAAGTPRLERLVTLWESCDVNSQIRQVVRTSTEDGSSFDYPLDDILEGKVNG